MEPTSVIWIYSRGEGDLLLHAADGRAGSWHVTDEDGCMAAFRAAVEMARGEGWIL